MWRADVFDATRQTNQCGAEKSGKYVKSAPSAPKEVSTTV